MSKGKTLIRVTADDAETAQNGPGATPPEEVATDTSPDALAALVALWLRGRSFSLGNPSAGLGPAHELLDYLRQHGYRVTRTG
jgi:hypothetical protein